MIKIIGTEVCRECVGLYHILGIGEKEVGVGLEMNQSAIDKKAAITFHEIGGGEPFARILHLRIGECEPDFLHLFLREEPIDDLNACAKKGHIAQLLLDGQFGTGPHTCAFDVNTDKIHVGK